MSSRLLSLKLVSSMVDRKLDNTEIGAILEAFSESREAQARTKNQSTTFKILLAFDNIYVLGFLVIYILLKNNLLQPLDANLITEDFLTVFDGRAHVMFWLLVLINMGAYFNIGFKIMCLISIIYMLNATVDNFVVFAGLVNFEDRPYLSAFLLSRPLFFVSIIWAGIVYDDAIADN
ncbi:hypothetical protein N8Z59_02820 [Planktomarina temperata]|nr:hypothetical protein [Planktomarina temperata]